MTCGNPDRSGLIYNTYELEILDQEKRQRKCKMDDQIKKFEVGNIIHYTGKVYDCNNFYAKIDMPFSQQVKNIEKEKKKLKNKTK